MLGNVGLAITFCVGRRPSRRFVLVAARPRLVCARARRAVRPFSTTIGTGHDMTPIRPALATGRAFNSHAPAGRSHPITFTASHRVHSKRRPLGLAPLRRLWILPVSIVVVTAIFNAVPGCDRPPARRSRMCGHLRARAALRHTPGAASLASTYAGALPNDPTLRSYVAETAHVNPLGTILAMPPGLGDHY